MEKSFVSCFSADLSLFLKRKREAGYKYDAQEYILLLFDRYCASSGVSCPSITKELVDNWINSFNGCCSKTVSYRVSALRQFSLFLLSNGKEAYIPAQRQQNRQHRIHVLSDAEISAVFTEIDHYIPKIKHPSFERLAMEYRFLFRLLLCCGMRVSKRNANASTFRVARTCADGNNDKILCER